MVRHENHKVGLQYASSAQGMFLGRSFFSFHMGDAISVCPFYCSRADIAPSEYVPIHWAFYPPKDPEQLRRVYDLGYRDTLTWLKKHGQIPYGAGLLHFTSSYPLQSSRLGAFDWKCTEQCGLKLACALFRELPGLM